MGLFRRKKKPKTVLEEILEDTEGKFYLLEMDFCPGAYQVGVWDKEMGPYLSWIIEDERMSDEAVRILLERGARIVNWSNFPPDDMVEEVEKDNPPRRLYKIKGTNISLAKWLEMSREEREELLRRLRRPKGK